MQHEDVRVHEDTDDLSFLFFFGRNDWWIGWLWQPTIYVAESAISTGAAGGDASGTGNSLAVVGGLALVAVAGAASVLWTVGKNAPAPGTSYVGPPLSYYVSKFSQETASSPPAFSAQVIPEPESPPLAEDMSLSKPEVAVTEPEAASDATQ
jgi:hypothetical protein